MPWTAHVSRATAETTPPAENTVVVSITDPHKPDAKLRPGWAGVLRLKFDDAELQRGADVLMTPEQAADVVAFVGQHPGSNVLAHCEHGVSRSAAVAYWLAGRGWALDKEQSEEWAAPNGLVVELLERAAKR